MTIASMTQRGLRTLALPGSESTQAPKAQDGALCNWS
jgi:hypothetical protein